MHLSSHSDSKTHALYVMRTDAMKRIPEAAIPSMPELVPNEKAGDLPNGFSEFHQTPANPARHAGLEPATFGFGGRRSNPTELVARGPEEIPR